MARYLERGEEDKRACLYLDQARTILADARLNLDSLEFYLPAGSVKDVNDPTWSLAEQAAEAIQEDSDELRTLSPPDSLAPANLALAQALARAATGAEAAITALSGNVRVGQSALTDFRSALADIARAENALPSELGSQAVR